MNEKKLQRLRMERQDIKFLYADKIPKFVFIFLYYDVIKIRLSFHKNAGQRRHFSCVMLDILDLLA